MFNKILVLALIVLFAVGAEAQETIPPIPIYDDEEFLEDTTPEPLAIARGGALCFHEGALSVDDRVMVEEYVSSTNGDLTFDDDCIKGLTIYGKYYSVVVPESYLSIPGSYIYKGPMAWMDHPSTRTVLRVLAGLCLLIILANFFLQEVRRVQKRRAEKKIG